MKKERSNYPVKLMARVLEVSRSGFYVWLLRGPSARKVHDDQMKVYVGLPEKGFQAAKHVLSVFLSRFCTLIFL